MSRPDRSVQDPAPTAPAGSAAALLCAALVLVTALCIVGMVVALCAHRADVFRPLAMSASTCFVLIAVVGGGLAYRYGRLVLAGLVFCWLGDYLGPGNFMLGLAAFLLAHVAFAGAFLARGLAKERALAALVAVLAGSGGLLVWLLPHVPSPDRLLVVAYAAAIGLMAVFAAGASRGRAGRVILLAAVLFYVSDIFVARWRFVSPGLANALVCYPLYYSACVLFAWTVVLERARKVSSRT